MPTCCLEGTSLRIILGWDYSCHRQRWFPGCNRMPRLSGMWHQTGSPWILLYGMPCPGAGVSVLLCQATSVPSLPSNFSMWFGHAYSIIVHSLFLGRGGKIQGLRRLPSKQWGLCCNLITQVFVTIPSPVIAPCLSSIWMGFTRSTYDTA